MQPQKKEIRFYFSIKGAKFLSRVFNTLNALNTLLKAFAKLFQHIECIEWAFAKTKTSRKKKKNKKVSKNIFFICEICLF